MRLAPVIALSCALVSCGRIGFESTEQHAGGIVDAGADPAANACDNGLQDGDETGVDCGGDCLACPREACAGDEDCRSGACSMAGVCLTSCRRWSAFSEPVLLEEASTSDLDWGPELTVDGLTLLYCTDGDLFEATRAGPDDLFGAGSAALGGQFDTDCEPTITGDGLELLYTNRGHDTSVIRTVTRPARHAPWGPDRDTPGLPTNLRGAWISKDGLRAYVVDDSAGNDDIVMVERATRTSPFGAPQPIFTGEEDDLFPSLSEDELTMVFMSSRSGPSQKVDLFMATRASTAEPFGSPTVLENVNSAEDEWDPAISADTDTLVFASLRVDPGNPDLYLSTRTCLEEAR